MHNKGKILIVDDEPNALRVLSAILSDEGYTVFDSINIDGAIKVIQQQDIDTIITDLNITGGDGYGFIPIPEEPLR